MSAISLKNISKHFGAVKAVDDVSFTVEAGEIFGFLGPNGAGKTTAIRCVMDFIRPNGGSVTLLGRDAQKDSVVLKRDIGYLPADVALYGSWTGSDHVRFIEKLRGTRDGVADYAQRLQLDLSKQVRSLSTGNLQKLGIVLALIGRPKLLILDEPTTGLDPLLQHELYVMLRELASSGSTVFMSSHNLHEVEEVCGRVAIIRAGKLMAVESIRTLKQKKIYSVRVSFEDAGRAAGVESWGLAGLDMQEQKSAEVHLHYRGDINPLLAKLTQEKLVSLEVEQAPLDEIFMEYYAK